MTKKEKKLKKAPTPSKTPELTNAKNALEAYLKENKLDPTKDWTNDKKHGKKVTELVNKLNKERDKMALQFQEKTFKKKAKAAIYNIEKAEKNEAVRQKIKAKKEAEKLEKDSSKPTAKRTLKYDYPLIDGREMNSEEKKAYRVEQRKLAKAKAKGEKPEEKKPKEKLVKVEKEKKSKKDKKAKAKKEED